MKRLWVRLSVAFSIVILMGIISLGVVSTLLNQGRIIRGFVLPRFQESGGVVDRLVRYYDENQTWLGVEPILERQDDFLPRGSGESLGLVFADSAGVILYDPHNNTVGAVMTQKQESDAIPIYVEHQLEGYLLLDVVQPPPPPDDMRPFLTQQLTNLLLQLGAVVAVVGVLAGVIVSRGMTAPLRDLAQTAREFGSKNLNKRASLKGSTEVVAVATAFNEMADELQRAELQRRNLTADVAHELRTPLTVLRANLQAIQDGIYPLNQDEVERLMEQTELLSHLVNDLHELSQAEAKKLPINKREIDLGALVEAHTAEFKKLAAEQGVSLHEHIPAQPVTILADSNRLRQVLNNLLHNALTHTPSGGAITLTLAQEGGSAKLTVQDTGGGISQEHLPHIFERFYRADRSRSRATGGTGLGLAIVKAIVEVHDGKVVVESEGLAGKGSAFTVILPLAA